MKTVARLQFGLALAVLFTSTAASHAQFLGKSVNEWVTELRSGDETQRRNAAFAIGKMGRNAMPGVNDLKRAVADKNVKVREAAIYALGEIGMKVVELGQDADLQSVLVTALKDPEPLVRRSAAFSLGCLGADAASTRTNVEAALSDASPEVRQSAAWALGRLGVGSALVLSGALRDNDPYVLRDAALSLALVGQLDPGGCRAAVDDLARLATNPDVEVRKAALSALVYIVKPADAKTPSVTKPLQQALVDGDLEVRRNAALTLCNIGGSIAVPAVDVLLEALKNGELEIKQQAALAFGNIGPAAERAVPALVDCLRLPDPELRINAINALAGLGPAAEPAVPLLVTITADRNGKAEDRAMAASALSKIGEVKAAVAAAPTLLNVASDGNDVGKVRERVMWALRVHNARLREMPGVLDAFKKILVEPSTKENRMVRQDCAYLTGMIFRDNAPPEIFPVLLQYLKDDSLQIFTGTKLKVGGAGQEVVPGKSETREIGDGDGRKLALDALKAIGPSVRAQPDIISQLRFLADSDRIAPSFKQECREYLKTLTP